MRRFSFVDHSFYQRGGIFYVRFREPDSGTWTSGISTGQRSEKAALREIARWEADGAIPDRGRSINQVVTTAAIVKPLKEHDLTADDARAILAVLEERRLIAPGAVVLEDTKAARPLTDYLVEFWDYDRSPYVRHRRALGESIGRRYCYDQLHYVKRHWVPAFEGVLMGEVSDAHIRRFLEGLPLELAAKSRKKILSAGRVPFSFARREGWIAHDPCANLERFRIRAKKRSVFSPEEARELFAADWRRTDARLAAMLSASTGLRLGEICALRVEDLGTDRLFVRHSWSEFDGLKTPKNGEERTVPIMPQLRAELEAFARRSPHGRRSWVFWSERDPQRPRTPKVISDGVRDQIVAMRVGWDAVRRAQRARNAVSHKAEPSLDDRQALTEVMRVTEELRDRGISFHSWRHFYSARLTDRLDVRKVQLATGHRTQEMAEHYAAHRTNQIIEEVFTTSSDTFGPILFGESTTAKGADHGNDAAAQ